jgi:Animal haem peroxidase
MPRLPHGRVDISIEKLRDARDTAADRAEETELGFAVMTSRDAKRFDYLFPQLQQNPDDLLPVTPDTVENLIQLGHAMKDTGDNSGDAEISAAYTYFGQFVDHDITLGTTSKGAQNLLSPDLAPLSLDEIRETTRNIRTATFELDSVYNPPAPRDPENRSKMRIGKVHDLGNKPIPEKRPPDKADENDLPRRRERFDPKKDRAALIGDARNDENTIIAQLHLAFLLAHNKLVDRGETYEEARKLLTQHYQHIVVHDFLRQVADPQIVDDILENGPRFYDPGEGNDFFLPMEFSVAAYRFGHSMVRAEYDFNLNFNTRGGIPATLGLLFTFSALSGQLGPGQGFPTLPENWIIEWENFFDPQGGEPRSKSRRFDTKLVEPLQKLRDELGNPLKDCARDTEAGEISASLAVRNLLRGYLLRMPTGQAVARELGEDVLTEDEIKDGAASLDQVEVLEQGGFLNRTPLWYYILVESAVRADGQHLGPVGSRLIAEVIIGLIQRSPDSIMVQQNWEPSLGQQQGKFDLPDLLRFAEVLS